MDNFKKSVSYLIYQLVIGVFFGVFLLISEWLIRSAYSINPLSSSTSVILTGIVIAFFYLHVKSRLTSFFIASYVTAIFSIEILHLAYFGYWIPAINLWLMFEKAEDVLVVGTTVLSKMTLPIILSVCLILAFYILTHFRKAEKKSGYFDLLLLIAFFFMPAKTFFGNSAGLGRVVHEEFSILKSGYYTTNYFLARILPQEVFGWSKVASFTAEKPKKISPGLADNIIIVMGESLSSKYVSAFDFDTQTTPWLETQRHLPSVVFKESYSAALFTDVSIPFMFNLIKRPNGTKQIASGDTNLFRLAKENGYETYFYSTQPSFGLGLTSTMGREWIDHYDDSFSLTGNIYQGVDDAQLTHWLANIDFSKRNFIVLNQNGSHEPYSKYVPDNAKLVAADSFYNEYLNSVYYTDTILSRAHQLVENRAKGDWLFLYTSDHGQYVTQQSMGKGYFGREANFLVPTYIDSNSPKLQKRYQEHFDRCPRIFHYQLSTLISHVLGYDTEIADCKKGYVSGGRLTGDSGYLVVDYEHGQFVTQEIIPS